MEKAWPMGAGKKLRNIIAGPRWARWIRENSEGSDARLGVHGMTSVEAKVDGVWVKGVHL